MKLPTTPIYYESHVTIEPVFDDRLEAFRKVCKQYNFHVATLVMQKRAEDTPERSKHDSFCTGHGRNGEELAQRMFDLLDVLKTLEFKVWRYKIEVVPLDSRYDDSLYKLDKSSAPEKERNPRKII